MLKSLKVTSGYAAELEDLKNRTFEFPAGKINVLYGPNGCGKTTILKMLAAYTGLDHSAKNFGGGGWSGPPTRAMLRDATKFPGVFHQLTPGKCKAQVEWDGVPAFYNSATIGDDLNMSYIVSGPKDSPDGLMNSQEQLSLIMGHHSEGELRAYKLGKVLDAIATAKPKPHVKPREGATELEKQYSNYVRGLRGRKKKCVYTLLWDEPDRSLSIENQCKIWTSILPHIFTDDLQIVIATHSAVVPLLPDFDFFNIIDVTKGYLYRSQLQLMRIMGMRLDDLKEKEDAVGSGETVGNSEESG